ncbi:tRNA (adenosine(37)-N6)-threonylcarbamoyltransferase complex dimerization subunit type 1 TsaB [Phyllobacterium sp. 628]|uniref:tRNA (adenosine(37)-N6)-threonylcarbamoyltransferase complex dimerization subunit type 1 TsaB n=1 Tax=Phyllobacterium sp. 628 TaxID=2718938 RepID=UPI0016623159|nr:tRNA (adenosine(37)-N6)-threonylcarbamoyltransferase complex dimerization subunit type 1 TsaB [Phyllobacterium sp. 628]QND51730.1 tRNA (adenosine(37)-N6)-threonylcarbamoyltransferase complex dimerization subunit type 1 TsaB [Phyllobacterium sp. 628]
MKLLALDTASNLCSVAVLDIQTGTMLAAISEDIGKGHAERLMGLVEQALAEAGVAIDVVTKIAVSIGPGSFTGVRVGVSTARGFALALKCPVAGVSTLEALAFDARQAFPGRPVLSIIDARRDEIYAQFFAADGSPDSIPGVTTLPEVFAALAERDGNMVLSGSGAALVNAGLEHYLDVAVTDSTGSIEAFARLGATRETYGEAPKPLYLRGLDVKPQQGFVLKRKVAE